MTSCPFILLEKKMESVYYELQEKDLHDFLERAIQVVRNNPDDLESYMRLYDLIREFCHIIF